MSNAFTLAENYKTEEYSQETCDMYEEYWFKESLTDTQFDEPLTPTELDEHLTDTQLEEHLTDTQLEEHLTDTQLEEHWTPTEFEAWKKNKNWWENQNPTNTPNSNWVDDDDIPVWR